MSRSEERLIFDAARHIAAPDARRAYLEQACHDDADLSARVAALLRARMTTAEVFCFRPRCRSGPTD
jgi:hypothetical protein